MSRTRSRKTFADRLAIPTGTWLERHNGVTIKEANRATGFEFREDGVMMLLDIWKKQYRSKDVPSVVYGLDDGETIKYAIFCKEGFLRPVTEDETLTKRKKR
jgi:hypothetical protein